MPDRSLALTVIESAGEELPNRLNVRVGECLRDLPGRRKVVNAFLDSEEKLLVKCYEHPTKAKADALLEWRSLTTLADRRLPVPAPRFLASLDDGGFAVGMDHLNDAQGLQEVLKKSTDPMARRAWLTELMKCVSQAYQAGAVQVDMHLGNVLVCSDRLWFIDAASFLIKKGALSRRRRVANLALLQANLDLPWQSDWIEAWVAGGEEISLMDAVQRRYPVELRRRIRRYRKKCLRTCTEFVREETAGVMWMRRRDRSKTWLQEVRLSESWPVEDHGKRYDLETNDARNQWITGNTLRLLGIMADLPCAYWEDAGVLLEWQTDVLDGALDDLRRLQDQLTSAGVSASGIRAVIERLS